MKYWELIADNLKKRGSSLGYVSAVDSRWRTIWIADAHRDGKRFVERADEKLTAFVELESAIQLYRRNLRNLRFNDFFFFAKKLKNCIDSSGRGGKIGVRQVV